MTSVAELESSLRQRQDALQRKVGEARAVTQQQKALDAEIAELSEAIDTTSKVLAVLHALSTAVQARFLTGIESLVSEGLSAVFEEPIKFRITATMRNRQVNLDFSLENADGTDTDLLDARGGGLISLTGVLLRIIMARLMSGQVRQLLILDEPLGFLSSGYQAAAGVLLRKLADELDMQLILVSHNQEIIESADTVYELRRTGQGVEASKLA